MASIAHALGRRTLLLKNPSISRSFICTSSKMLANADSVTHTGQVFEKDDYKRVRFTDRKKTVNERFAIDLIDEVPPIEVDSHVVWCDGGRYSLKTVGGVFAGGVALGHPKVYINLDQDGAHACGYCGLRYVMKSGAH